jgi:hypothetical protein
MLYLTSRENVDNLVAPSFLSRAMVIRAPTERTELGKGIMGTFTGTLVALLGAVLFPARLSAQAVRTSVGQYLTSAVKC